MNTKYDTGNVIRSKTSFNEFKFPNELPTEEWAGNEARSYGNYLRPVANLFENDRELETLSHDILLGMLKSGKNGVINGCDVVGHTVVGEDATYFEVKPGTFIYNRRVYHIYPECEAVAKQIEAEFESNILGDLTLKITYDNISGTYDYEYTKNFITVKNSDTITSAVVLIDKLLKELGLCDDTPTGYDTAAAQIEDHIILPILKVDNLINDVYVYFDGSTILNSEQLPSTSLRLATLASESVIGPDKFYFFDGDKVSDSTVKNSSLINNSITIGNTVFELGVTRAEINGLNSINSVSIGTSINGIVISDGNNELIIDSSYRLKDACTKSFTSDINAGINDPLPTSSAVKNYVEGGNYTILDTVTHKSQLVVEDTTNASKDNNQVSGEASIYTLGGIEAKGDIYSEGSIVGTGAGTYSHSSLKENISPFSESAVDLINHVLIVNYNYKSDEEKNHKIGFLADYTHEYFSTKEKNIMDIPNCIGILLKAVQELSAENKELKERLDGIEFNQRK